MEKILIALAAHLSLAARSFIESAANKDSRAVVENIMTLTSIRSYT